MKTKKKKGVKKKPRSHHFRMRKLRSSGKHSADDPIVELRALYAFPSNAKDCDRVMSYLHRKPYMHSFLIFMASMLKDEFYENGTVLKMEVNECEHLTVTADTQLLSNEAFERKERFMEEWYDRALADFERLRIEAESSDERVGRNTRALSRKL